MKTLRDLVVNHSCKSGNQLKLADETHKNLNFSHGSVLRTYKAIINAAEYLQSSIFSKFSYLFAKV